MNENQGTQQNQIIEQQTTAMLTLANKELAFQNQEKEKRAGELIIVKNELAFQNEEKEKRAAELIIANAELVFQIGEKEKRAAELIVANEELAYQNQEKEKRAIELAIVNAELLFQNQEKEKRAVELLTANAELKKAEDNIKKLNEEDIRKLNEELKSLNHRLQLATKSANLGIWDWDLMNNTIKWDQGMYNLYDVEEQKPEVFYEVWLSKLHSEDRERVVAELKMAREGIKRYDTEFRILGRHNRIQVIRATGVVDLDETGMPFSMVGINWEITERRAAEQEREVIIKEMSKRNAELEQFSYIISHNIRSPVANIIGAASVLNDPDLKGDDQLFLINAVQQSALNLDSIITDLNDVLKIKHGNYTKESVNFTDLLDTIKLSIIDQLKEFTISCDFLAIGEMFTVRSYLHSIFYNLISNSLKYRRTGINGNIKIKSELIAGKMVLTFADNGLGINMEKYGSDIFGLYKRFHTDLPGKGMGLFMVKSQVEILGGTVTIKSKEGIGTEFRIEFNESAFII